MDDKISDIVPDEYKKRAIQLSKDHVEWFITTIKPLLMTFGIHLYRHGYEDRGLEFERQCLKNEWGAWDEEDTKEDI